MNKPYSPNCVESKRKFFKKNILNFVFLLMLFFFLAPSQLHSQQIYTLIEGSETANLHGVTPFSTGVRNQRSQYLYISDYLENLNAPAGYITAVAVKITQVALPTSVQPQNLQIKMGLTSDVTLTENLIPNLPVYYSSANENITSEGWYTINLDTPFAWDGYSNIVMEFCRTNVNIGTSFEIEVHLGLINEYRTTGLTSNTANGNGCTLTGSTLITLPNRRLLPSMQITMANPCESTPSPGTVVVSSGNDYCGEPFTLSVNEDTYSSGLSYQWQYSFVNGNVFVDILGANSPTLTTTQEFATYYRRGIMCDAIGEMIYNGAILVSGPNCVCNPTVSIMDESGITNVSLNTINSTTTSTPYYSDFRVIETELQKTVLYNLSAKVTTTTNSQVTKAWIDWNHDGVFSPSEGYELGTVSTGTDVSSGAVAIVQVPENALLGKTTMRIRTASANDLLPLEPCGNTENGESEDYSVIVKNDLSLSNNVLINNSVVVYGSNNTVNIKSSVEEIESVKIYDLSGRLLFSDSKINNKHFAISLRTVISQILIVEIKTTSGFAVNKKVSLN